MAIKVEPSGAACGARVTGVDLAKPLADADVAAIRAAWIEHAVLAFPNQRLDDDDLERFTLAFGPFGEDPFIAPIPGRDHVIAVSRAADETSPIFAENWHTDWSFQAVPPAGTVLRAVTIPPVGGDTLFADQRAALEAMPAGLRARIEGAVATHSAKRAYAPDGTYGEGDRGRSMDIRPSHAAEAAHRHPLIRRHPETGREALYGTIGYIVGLEHVDDPEATLLDVYAWQTQDRFVHRHVWEPDMLLMWDNRSVLHRATGGYEGHARLLHRTTIGERQPAS
jgi:taurine dioxygenase